MNDPSERKPSFWKRFGVFFLDAFIVFGVYLGLVYGAGNFALKAATSNEISIIQEEYQTVMVTHGYPYIQEEIFGFYQFDDLGYIKSQMEAGKTYEQAEKAANEASTKIDEEVTKSENYNAAFKTFFAGYNLMRAACMTIPMIIFELIIPVATKKRQTLFMKVFRLGMAKKEDSTPIPTMRVVGRFFLIYVVEYLSLAFISLYIGWEYIAYGFGLLASVASMSFTRNRATIHDLLFGINVKNVDDIYTLGDPEDAVVEEQ